MVNEVMKFLTEQDPEIGKAVEKECARQRRNLELIASENIVSEAVMMAMGTVLTNKYAEGYPGKRYYGGCEVVDEVETIAIERCEKAVWLRLCQCAATFRSAGEYGSICGNVKAWRYGNGNEFKSWRPPDPWKPSEFFRTLF